MFHFLPFSHIIAYMQSSVTQLSCHKVAACSVDDSNSSSLVIPCFTGVNHSNKRKFPSNLDIPNTKEMRKTCLETCMNIKHVVAVVAQVCVETDSNSWLFPESLDVKGETTHPEPRQRGNATSPHTLLCWLLQGKQAFYPTSFPLTLCNAWKIWSCLVCQMHNNRKLSMGAPNTLSPNRNLFFSCAFGPMSMSFWHLHWINLYKIVLSFHIGHYQTFDIWPTGHGLLGNRDRIIAQPC